MTFAIDFDGTIVTHKYPSLGIPVPLAIPVILELQKKHNIILFTMRSKDPLQEAVDYLHEQGVQLYGINKNSSQLKWTSSPKVYANHYIDDAALGTPLSNLVDDKRPHVDWNEIRLILYRRNIIPFVFSPFESQLIDQFEITMPEKYFYENPVLTLKQYNNFRQNPEFPRHEIYNKK